ncbi:kinase-like domain-containing protein [Xylariaceae sp. FL0804]|nr:kinase-like domain-containing protein [Xylariaceae sp. FL0804]
MGSIPGNLVRLLQFSDGTQWVARISLSSSPADLAKLLNEINTMQLIKDRSTLPIPRVFAYEANTDNPVGVPFILMDFLPGNTGMDAAGGWEVHKGCIPLLYRQNFYRAIAKHHVELSALRSPKIGVIVKHEDGEYGIGPFPELGGPFTTTASFLESWANHVEFLSSKEEILQMMRGGPAEQVLTAITEFPSRIRAWASQLSHEDDGPFPLCHTDFLHSNIIVDERFKVLGIIDWEGACTLPLELVAFPAFLSATPVMFDSPENYDKDGLPLDDEQKQRWKDREEYVDMVEYFEQDDRVLSSCLKNTEHLALAYAITAYSNGKLGLYDEVIEELSRG